MFRLKHNQFVKQKPHLTRTIEYELLTVSPVLRWGRVVVEHINNTINFFKKTLFNTRVQGTFAIFNIFISKNVNPR